MATSLSFLSILAEDENFCFVMRIDLAAHQMEGAYMSWNGLAKYLYEIGLLKYQKRTGWWRMGVREPESVAEHSYRTAVIGYILASLVGANPEKTALLCLFHDMAETRIGDMHWITKRYIQAKEGENAASREQVGQLPQEIATSISVLVNEYNEQSSLEALAAREADLIECLLQAREYQIQGYTKAQEWATMCYKDLKTEAAKNLASECLRTDPGAWYEELQSNPHLPGNSM